jgi:pimeloyl-ACP methyl ester carboxylesterase
MNECFCRVGDIELCYETFGDPADPAVLLVMGLATQMLGWPDDFCAQVAGRGFHVIRFDNRDIGRSTRLSQHAPPTTGELLRRDRRSAAYSLSDMAADGIGLLDHLGIERAHVVGASMGGMIAQEMAIGFPERVLSLCSIMSNTGARMSGQPALALYATLLRPPPRERQAAIEYSLRLYTEIGSPDFERDELELRDVIERSYARGHDPAGPRRQLAAIIAGGNRTDRLRRLRLPTVVIHGTRDRLVRPSGGRAVARAVPGARLVEIHGMGHDLPRAAWPRIIDAIVDNAARAGASSAATSARR